MNLKTHSKKPCTANAVQGFSNYRFLYAERKVSDSYNAGPHEFNSSFGKQYVRQLGSRPCRAEGQTSDRDAEVLKIVLLRVEMQVNEASIDFILTGWYIFIRKTRKRCMILDVQRFGAFIQSRRKELGLTQGELGQKLNVTDKAISRWERCVGFPDINLLEPLADALQISIQELMQCEHIKTEEKPVEMKAEPWLYKHRRSMAVLCALVYALFSMLAGDPQLVQQLVWMSPLNRLLFLVTVAAFLYASYREVHNG